MVFSLTITNLLKNVNIQLKFHVKYGILIINKYYFFVKLSMLHCFFERL
jgi:hypothetical protein